MAEREHDKCNPDDPIGPHSHLMLNRVCILIGSFTNVSVQNVVIGLRNGSCLGATQLLTESLLRNNLLNYIVNFVIDILRTRVSSKCENRNICICHNDSQSLFSP